MDVRMLANAWLVAGGLAAGTANASGPGGYSFCEAPGPGARAYVTPVFDGRGADPQASFEHYLAARYRLDGVRARCFTLASERDARQFRTQRIELFHWDGWQHVVATSWTPDSEAAVAGGGDHE